MSDWTLCIDFGTAFSKAAAAPTGAWSRFDPDMVRPLRLGQHEGRGNAFLLDSAVFVDDARVLFGRAAIARADAIGAKKRSALKSFKTLLSVSDLDRALNTNAPLSIDPHRIFQMRDLIVLYLAYLLAAIEKARGLDPMIKGRIARRYAAPAWRGGDSAGLHGTVVKLFGEAEAFRARAGDALLSEAGLDIDSIVKALPKAMEGAPLDMGLIYEATAAAAYTSIGLDDSASHLLVVDMGAGTTDIAALARIGNRMFELPEARSTLKHAGDFIDRVIANKALDAAKWAKTTDQQTALWAELMRGMRDTKETLFEDGRASVRYRDHVYTLGMKDVERDKDFQAFSKELKAAYEHCVAVVRDDASARGRSAIEAVAVGGGAAAPFIQALIASKNTRGARPRITPRPATPDWAHAPEFGGALAPVFPQLAIAIGGALAPDTMLAARGTISPVASARNGSPAARD